MGTATKYIDHKKSNAVGEVKPAKKGSTGAPVVDLRNDPYFVKKAESAKRLLDKYGTLKR